MLKQITLCLFLSLTISSWGDNKQLFNSLDDAITRKGEITNQKQSKINALKRQVTITRNPLRLLQIYERLYEEYYVYQFDSATIYINEALDLAYKRGNKYHINLNTMNKARLLATGGLYNEAINTISSVNPATLDNKMLFMYHITFFTLFNYYADYCNDKYYSPEYRRKATENLEKAIPLLNRNDKEYDYFMGEYYTYARQDARKAMRCYQNVVRKSTPKSRYYAMASFAIANNYSAHGNMKMYEEYMVKSCVSDILCCTKENLALQDLATYIFKQDKGNIERADMYITESMKDAKFYNNRLRILEISQVLPTIVSAYQTMTKEQNDNLKTSLIVIFSLAVALIIFSYLIFRQNNKLTLRRNELAKTNKQLTLLYDKVSALNTRLSDTNSRREGLAKLYIDLCAKYIDKLSKYQNLVKRKIKANQVNELLSTMSSSRLSEEDAAIFMHRFDEAFLDLYPSFVSEFNALLRSGEQIITAQHQSMGTELRIFALIRLGVKDSSEIASLLFYSPQTIYNYRSKIKNKAINKDTMEDDIMNLCKVM